MWRVFSIWLLWQAAALQGVAQQRIYDLRHDWQRYDYQTNSYRPMTAVTPDDSVSFVVPADEFAGNFLVIALPHETMLLYNGRLLAELPAGLHHLKIDSLAGLLDSRQPMLTLYAPAGLSGLQTYITCQPPRSDSGQTQPAVFNNSYSNFFFTVLLLVLLVVALLRWSFPDLAGQYFAVGRALRPRLISELIYKVNPLAHPNIHYLLFMSFVMGLVWMHVQYFFPDWWPAFGWQVRYWSYATLLLGWVGVSLVFFLFLILKYLLIRAVDTTFNCKLTHIHYASFLRLWFILSLLLLFLVTMQFLHILWLSPVVFNRLLLILIILIEVVVFLKLTFAATHTVLYLIIYFCATEIVPMVLFLQLVLR
ncbi:MAG TPA: DUF4271 domain-containing protein [Flammeovirgaceae bacterium]|nr:DUF4271 domain-containing protein [Flammeovirgaceae bacterium]